MKTKSSRKALVNRADKLFSLYVRLRDSENGYGHCITCGKRLHYKDAHAGHFQKRKYLETRWDEENVNLQCSACNTFNDGEQYKYGQAIELKYGDDTADKLHVAARGGIGQKFPSSRIEEVIADTQVLIDFIKEKA